MDVEKNSTVKGELVDSSCMDFLSHGVDVAGGEMDESVLKPPQDESSSCVTGSVTEVASTSSRENSPLPKSPDSALGTMPDPSPVCEDSPLIPSVKDEDSLSELPALNTESVNSLRQGCGSSQDSDHQKSEEPAQGLLNEDSLEDSIADEGEVIIVDPVQSSVVEEGCKDNSELESTENCGTDELMSEPQAEQAQSKEVSPSGFENDVEDNTDDDQCSECSTDVFGGTSSAKLPDTVTRLETPEGSSVFLVGTAHFSKESQEDVATTIRTVSPDVIVLELCKARTAILLLDEDTILEESHNLGFNKIMTVLNQHGRIRGILYLLLLSVSAHITKELGMAPGGEFRAAYAEARRSVPGCLILLGDRPIGVTLSRALASLSLWHKVKLTWHILTSKVPISKEEVEKCKQRDFIEEVLKEMTGEFPAISRVFVTERDIYLTRSLQNAARPVPSSSTSTGFSPRVVVGVVGIGHVPGIVQRWGKVSEADIPPILAIPPPSLSSRVAKILAKVSCVGLITLGVYKCLPTATGRFIRESANSAYSAAVKLMSAK